MTRGLFAFNLDEEKLRARFIEPWGKGAAVTWKGQTIRTGDMRYLRISHTGKPWGPEPLAQLHRHYDMWSVGEEVTDDWITGPPGGHGHAQTEPRGTKSAPLDEVVQICRRFDTVVRRLGRRHENRGTLVITDEYDVQDLLHALLLVKFGDVRPESYNAEYLGKATRTDFLLPEERIVIEAKVTRSGRTDKKIGSELAEDVTRYGAGHGADVLVCFVHDPDRLLANPVGLQNDLAKASNEHLRVVGVVSPS